MTRDELDSQVMLEIFRGEIRWYHWTVPVARNKVTYSVRTDAVMRLVAQGKVDIGTAEPGSYSVPSLIRPEITHACPPAGAGLTPCCGRTPFELPRTDRMTVDRSLVTCRRGAGPDSTSPEPGPPTLGARMVANRCADNTPCDPTEVLCLCRHEAGPATKDGETA